ncbi:MAG: NAD(P)/FAD-dependent oxidoreductase [Candidatus Bathyarchaeia archaeon]
MTVKTDIAVIGAGPAGLFAALELAERCNLKVLVIDQGNEPLKRVCPEQTSYRGCSKCIPCNVLCGAGGAGTLSSGRLNLRPDIGGDLVSLVRSEEEARNLIAEVDKVFLKYGCPEKLYNPKTEEVAELERRAAAFGVKFISIPQREIGTDRAPMVIQNFMDDLRSKGVEFLLRKKVTHLDKGVVQLNGGEVVECKYILAAPGRSGQNWLAEEARRLKIPTKYEPIDIGVRVEVPSVIMEPITRINRDPKFHIYTETYDDFLRTFCVNHEGFVCLEVYDEGYVGVNGHCMSSSKSSNTNFAFLVRVALTEPLEDSSAYGRTIATQTTTLGGGRPIIQRLGDLVKGRRSTWDRIERGNVKPTLRSVTPGDIAMAMPHRLVTDIVEGLRKLDHVIPGVASASTLLYAPEVKFSAHRIYTNKYLETTIENIFVAGDGAGLSRGIATAAATGILAARGILRKEGITIKNQ